MGEFWTESRVRQAKGILNKHTGIESAVEEMCTAFGRSVSRHSLKAAFRRYDDAPSSFLNIPVVGTKVERIVKEARSKGRHVDPTVIAQAIANDPVDDIPIFVEFEDDPTYATIQQKWGGLAFKNTTGRTLRILFIPDSHHPYVDPRAWECMLKAGRAFKPDIIVILGDFGDFQCTSRHTKDPNRERFLDRELDTQNKALDEVDSLGAQWKFFIKGNHEYNVERYLAERAPELYNLVKVEKELRLVERGWNLMQYREGLFLGKVFVTHDLDFAGKQAHIQSQAAAGTNVIIGHTHRASIAYSSTIFGESHLAAMMGWLGDRKMAEYMHKAKTKDWQLGFGTGHMTANDVVHVQFVPIIDYTCVVAGELLCAA